MRKRGYLVAIVLLAILFVALLLNGDRLYEWLLRMHGVRTSH